MCNSDLVVLCQDPKTTIMQLKNHVHRMQQQLDDEKKRHEKQREEDRHSCVAAHRHALIGFH